jgi:hypothetical protein
VPAGDLIATFLTAQAAFTERVHAIADDQWQAGTPDAQWTVADLVWHLTGEHRWAGPLLAGLDLDQARAMVAGLGPADGDERQLTTSTSALQSRLTGCELRRYRETRPHLTL